MRVPKSIQDAFLKSVKARTLAHAPYSRFKVGAALVCDDGTVVTGCNVENASYGGAVCAERTAILKAVSQGKKKFSDIVVVTGTKEPAAPCGFCLQTMAEFFSPSTKIWLANPKGIKKVRKFSQILPFPFGPRELKAK